MVGKLFMFAVLALALTLTLSGAALAQDTLKIGVAGAHSGDLASYGISALRGAEFAVEKVNAAGGINGKQVEIVKGDEQCKPELATNVATKMVADGIMVVMGHICSGATKAALGIYKDAKVITISPSATNPPLTQSGDYPNFYRTIASDDAQALMEVNFAKSKGFKKLAVLHDKGDYGKGLAEFAKSFIEADKDLEMVLYEGITPGAVDYSAVIQKIKQSGAEAVIFGGYHPEASKLVAGMRKKKMDTTFISDDGVKDDTFIKVAGEFAEGVFATGPKDVSKNPLAIEATEWHKTKFSEDPGAFFLTGVAATQALLNAIAKSGGTDYDKLGAALKAEDVETPLGTIKFDERGDAIGVGFAVYEVQKGQYVELK
jgi:branched-chain amino acid transport system substrate-binding protein